MDWQDLDSNHTFRIFFNDENNKNNNYDFISTIEDLILWKKYQKNSPIDLYVIKIGYSHYFSIKFLEKFFSDLEKISIIFEGKPVRIAFYQKIHHLDWQNIHYFNTFVQKLLKKNIYLTISWIVDSSIISLEYLENFLFTLQKKSFSFFNVLLIQNIDFLMKQNKIYSFIKIIDKFSQCIQGYDISYFPNHLYEKPFSENIQLMNFAHFLKLYFPHLAKKILPECINYIEKNIQEEQNFQEKIDEFLLYGYSINIHQNQISPLIYGSVDDFHMKIYLSIDKFLLMKDSEIQKYYQKEFLKIFSKSYCFQCSHYEQCKFFKLFFLNLYETKSCSLNILEFDKKL
jgi:hypothetical protein